MKDETNLNEVTAMENAEPETRSSNLSVYEKEFDIVYELEITDDIPIVVNQDGKRTLLLLQLNIDAKIKAYLDKLGILDRIEDLEDTVDDLDDKIDDLEEKIEELEENGGGSGSGSGDDSDKKLADYTWAEIKAFADAGTASTMFEVGDTKDITTAEGTRTLAIMHFNHPYFKYSSGKTCAIIFGTVHAGYSTAKRNTHIYKNDTSYHSLIENMLNGFDSDLKTVISSMTYTFNYEPNSQMSASENRHSGYTGKIMALPYEMMLVTYNNYSPYEYGFQYYNRDESPGPSKKSNNGTGDYCMYMTASGYAPSSSVTSAMLVYGSSGLVDYDTSYKYNCYDSFIFAI